MHWTPKYASAKIHICTTVNQALSSFIVLLPNGQTQRRTTILVQKIRISLIHQQPLNNTRVSHHSSFVQWSPLSIISLILIKVLI